MRGHGKAPPAGRDSTVKRLLEPSSYQATPTGRYRAADTKTDRSIDTTVSGNLSHSHQPRNPSSLRRIPHLNHHCGQSECSSEAPSSILRKVVGVVGPRRAFPGRSPRLPRGQVHHTQSTDPARSDRRPTIDERRLWWTRGRVQVQIQDQSSAIRGWPNAAAAEMSCNAAGDFCGPDDASTSDRRERSDHKDLANERPFKMIKARICVVPTGL